MTFGSTLQENIHEPWRLEYVSYVDIIHDFKQRQKDHQWNENDENQFVTAITLETEKVDFFINKTQKEIDARIAYCERVLKQQKAVPDLLESTYKTLDGILLDLHELSKFTRYNVLALRSIIEIHDKNTTFNAYPLFVNLIRSKYLDKQRFDPTLVKITALRDTIQPTNNVKSTATARYWIHSHNIKELEAILLFHLPMLVSNASSESMVHSVYLDNSNFDCYQKRLQLDDFNEVIRFCWYGSTNSPKNTFLERQIRQLSGITKYTLCLDTKKANEFIYGTYTADQYAEDLKVEGVSEKIVETNKSIATSIQNSIMENGLVPRLHVIFQRTIFQVPGDSRLQISLDTNLSYICKDGVSWSTNVEKSDPYRFPYAILETKFQAFPGEDPPQWLTNLLTSSLVYEIPRFSKYLHGLGFLKYRQLPMHPWWLGQLELNIQNANNVSGSLADIVRSKNLKPVINSKHSIGYLNSQLDRLSSVKKHDPKLTRTDSGKFNRQRDVSFISGSSLARTSSVIRPTLGNSHPMWSQENFSQENFSPRSGSLPREQYNYSSTDNLIDKDTTDSSYISSRKKKNNKPQKEAELNTLFLEDVTDLEAGQRSEGEKKKKKKKDLKDVGATVEPKVFFASERTFIRWLHFAATLMMCALTLLNFGDTINRIVGIVFFCICFIFAFYAFGFFRWRAYRIRYKPHLRYDDWFGPPMLCVLLITALTVSKTIFLFELFLIFLY